MELTCVGTSRRSASEMVWVHLFGRLDGMRLELPETRLWQVSSDVNRFEPTLQGVLVVAETMVEHQVS